MILKLNLTDFYINFLNILVDINKEGKGAIFVKDNQINSITSVNNNSIYLYNTYTPTEIINPIPRFNINLQKLKVALTCIDNNQTVDLTIADDDNKLTYKDDSIKFDIRLLSDKILTVPAFNINTFKELTYSFSTVLNRDAMNRLKKGDSFCGETNKFYIRLENDKLVFLFGDKQTQQNNEMKIVLDVPYTGICTESVFDSAILRLLFKEKNDITMKLNDRVLVFETNTPNSQQVYITSKLKK